MFLDTAILGSVLDSGKCFVVWEVFLDSDKCFEFREVFCMDSGKCY